MPEGPDPLQVVGAWIAKAENDLKTVKTTDTVCFHAQQCVEKCPKALLAHCGQSFPRTHDLVAICVLLPDAWRPDLPPKVLAQLSIYGTVTRYPGEYEEIGFEEAREAVAIARKVRDHVRAIVPPEALGRDRST